MDGLERLYGNLSAGLAVPYCDTESVETFQPVHDTHPQAAETAERLLSVPTLGIVANVGAEALKMRRIANDLVVEPRLPSEISLS